MVGMHLIYQSYSFLLSEESGQYCTLATKKKSNLKIKPHNAKAHLLDSV